MRAAFETGEPVIVEIRGLSTAGLLTVWHLGQQILEVSVTPHDAQIGLGVLPPGGYGVELLTCFGLARTAVEVRGSGSRSMRYGFVADYSPGREPDAVADAVRRLHLTDVQFYDWAYRHADLLGGGPDYLDALGQPVSLDTVRALVDAVHRAGAAALGYAAVYAVGPDQWATWAHCALATPSGGTYGLGDFLSLIDPAAPDWCEHFCSDLTRAVAQIGFDGFHLDQYGYPKWATRADGEPVDVAESFVRVIAAARHALPESRLVFNNVNDFPTWRTAGSPQDAVYVEVWPPHRTLGGLAAVASRARVEAPDKPVVVAAYQHVYDVADARSADTATALTMATLFSHGATHLLTGEGDRVLVDPYYVRNHKVDATTAAFLRRWYDFLVENGELLMHRDAVDVTGSLAGSYNDDCDVLYDACETMEEPAAGAIWRRVIDINGTLIVHLINLTGQVDTLWDAARNPPGHPGRATLRLRRAGPGLPRVRVADPDGMGRLVDVPVSADGDHVTAALPQSSIWQMVVVDQVDPRAAR